MNHSYFIRFFLGLMLTVPFATVSMDKWEGTWILNVQKSQYGQEKPPLEPSLLRQILKIHIANGTLDLYSRTELADGTDFADESHLLDLAGKPHVTEFDGFKPVTETFKQIDGSTFEITVKARPTQFLEVPDGELTVKVRFTMSADGKTIRETKEYHYGSEPNPAEGSVLVFDRQPLK